MVYYTSIEYQSYRTFLQASTRNFHSYIYAYLSLYLSVSIARYLTISRLIVLPFFTLTRFLTFTCAFALSLFCLSLPHLEPKLYRKLFVNNFLLILPAFDGGISVVASVFGPKRKDKRLYKITMRLQETSLHKLISG